MIDIDKRRLSLIGVNGIKRFLKRHPDCKVIIMYVTENGFPRYTTFQDEKMRIEENRLRGYRYNGNGFDINIDLNTIQYCWHMFLCVDETEFEEMYNSFMRNDNTIKEITDYHNKRIEFHTSKLRELATKTNWYEGLH